MAITVLGLTISLKLLNMIIYQISLVFKVALYCCESLYEFSLNIFSSNAMKI